MWSTAFTVCKFYKTQTSTYNACKMIFKLAEKMHTNLMRVTSSGEKMDMSTWSKEFNSFLIYLYL